MLLDLLTMLLDLEAGFAEWASAYDKSGPWEFMRCLELADPAESGPDLRGDFLGITSFSSSMDAARLGTNEGRHCPQSYASAALLAIPTIDLEALPPTRNLSMAAIHGCHPRMPSMDAIMDSINGFHPWMPSIDADTMAINSPPEDTRNSVIGCGIEFKSKCLRSGTKRG